MVAVMYTQKDFANREKYRGDYDILVEIMLNEYVPETALDIGSANGFLVQPFYDRGIDVRGVEISDEAVGFYSDEIRDLIQISDFRMIEGSYDMVCCIEMAEHIVPSRSVELVEVINDVAGKVVWFSAATARQKGVGHINGRPHEFWVELFEERDWTLNETVTGRSRALLKQNTRHIGRWLSKNMMYFERSL